MKKVGKRATEERDVLSWNVFGVICGGYCSIKWCEAMLLYRV